MRAGAEVRSDVWRTGWEDAREAIWSREETVWLAAWTGVAPVFGEDLGAGIVRAVVWGLPWL